MTYKMNRAHITKPRLLYVSTLDNIVRAMLPHLDAARAAGFTVEVACRVTRFADQIHPHVEEIHDLPFQRFPLHPANLVALNRLVHLLRARDYTIVHAHNPTGGFVGRLAATRAKVPVRAYTPHGFHFHRQGGRITNAVYRAIERFAGQHLSDGVFVINGEDYEAALQGRVVPEERLFMTRGVGISTEDFEPARITSAERLAVRRELSLPEGTYPVLAVLGEMSPNKRTLDALAAFVEIRRHFENAHLVLIGGGKREEKVKVEARRQGVWEQCRFLGWRHDIARLLSVCDLLLFPSAREGLPCSIQEALCMEVPVAASNVRGNRDLIDPSCGRIVPLRDTEALAAAAVEMLSLPEPERRRMGAAGRAKMAQDYGRAPCVARWLEIYETLLARKGLALPHEAETALPSLLDAPATFR